MSDLCLVISERNIHWCLDRIAKEIGKRYKGEVEYCYDLKAIPQSSHYFVTHYSLLPQVFMKANPATSKVTTFFTHESVPIPLMKDYMNLCHAVVCENSVEFHHLVREGINPNILHSVVECSDPNLFRPHQRTGKGSVLISSACYPRKNPQLVSSIIQSSPDLNFKIIGKAWESYIPIHKNCEYLRDLPYDKYPEEYAKCDIFLSCAKIEGGGPGGLIESMHSNLFPVVSDTGNAREYIVEGYNGYIFPIDSSPQTVISMIREAYKAHPEDQLPYNDVWQTVQHYTWDSYAIQMGHIINGTLDEAYLEPDIA